jgi:xanthine dehydrogenase D subunit/xanthine dehydrogenase C subunit
MTPPAVNFTVRQVRSLGEAVECFAPSARFVAGGTALQLEWANGITAPATLIALGDIADLKGVTRRGDLVRIGALTPLADLERHHDIHNALPLLAAAIQSVAAPSVRQLATLGGNVAGRTGCLLPALLALDATLEGFASVGTWRRSLDDWLSTAATSDAIITAVEVAAMRDDSRWTTRKIGRRATFSPSVIGVAGRIEVNAGRVIVARLAVGGGIVPAARLPRAEAWLETQDARTIEWDSLHERLTAEINAPDDAFRSARYRRLAGSAALVSGLGGRLPGQRSARARIPAHDAPAPEPAPAPAAQPEPAPAATVPGEIQLTRRAHPTRWHPRPDGAAKVAGGFRYLTDHRAPGMLVGRILRAGRAHARILSIDTRRAEALAGVIAVVTHRDVPGLNAFGIIVQDQPALCHDVVRYAGDAVAAVAAVDAATAEAALALIDVRYESLPVVTDPQAALEPGAPRLHAGGNLQRRIDYARGDVDAGFAACTHILDESYVTPRQMHGFMETEGGWASLAADGTLAMHAGGQHAFRDRLQLARILALPEEKIRVVTSPTGGAFGGKDELTVQPALGLLALKARRPVRLQLSRAESVLAGTKRHPMCIRMRTGCDADGRLLAQEVDVLADAGAYASLGPCVLETALEHAAGTYDIPHVKTRGRLAYTNNGVGGAFRGFGANQMNAAIECQMDRLAALCGLSPVEIRRRNLKRPELGFFGHAIAPSERLGEMLTAAASSPLWALAQTADADPDEVIGVGMAMNHHGNGLGSLIPDSGGGRLRLARDGHIDACFTLDEMGQGLLALVVGAVSAELGCGRDDVRPVIGDTSNGLDSGSTTAARGTYVVWRTLRLAGPVFADKLCAAAAAILGRDAKDLTLGSGGIIERHSTSGIPRTSDLPVESPAPIAQSPMLLRYSALAASLPADDLPCADAQFDYPRTDYQTGNARLLFTSGACIARVAVSRVTGEVRVLDLDQRSAAGPVVDMAAYLGQLEGGAVQAIGFTLTEDAAMTQGVYLTRNFDTYLMPSIADTPARMTVYALEALDAGDEYGPRGVGELGIGAVTPAIANAVRNAIGLCPTLSPISPEAILDALAARA